MQSDWNCFYINSRHIVEISSYLDQRQRSIHWILNISATFPRSKFITSLSSNDYQKWNFHFSSNFRLSFLDLSNFSSDRRLLCFFYFCFATITTIIFAMKTALASPNYNVCMGFVRFKVLILFMTWPVSISSPATLHSLSPSSRLPRRNWFGENIQKHKNTKKLFALSSFRSVSILCCLSLTMLISIVARRIRERSQVSPHFHFPMVILSSSSPRHIVILLFWSRGFSSSIWARSVIVCWSKKFKRGLSNNKKITKSNQKSVNVSLKQISSR